MSSHRSVHFIRRALAAPGEAAVALLRRFVRAEKQRPDALLPSQWFFFVGTALLFCVPHECWNNLFGVLFAVLALFIYWRDCAVYGMKPRSGIVLGFGVWLFLFWCLVITFRAEFPLASLRVALFYFAGFLLAYVAAALFDTAKARHLWVDLIFIMLTITALYGLLRYALGRDTYLVPIGDTSLPRLASTMEHAINYSELIALFFPLCLVRALLPGQKKRRYILSAAALLVIFAALLLTYARTGWLALGAALVLLFVFWKPKWVWVLIPLAALMVLIAPASIRERLLSVFTFTNDSSSGRFVLWGECLRMLRDHWLLGVGLGPENFTAVYDAYATGLLFFAIPHANMTYLDIFLSLGIVGFAGFALFFFGIFVRAGKALRTLPKERRWGIYAAVASLAGAALAAVPEHIWFYPRVLYAWCLVYGLTLAFLPEASAPLRGEAHES